MTPERWQEVKRILADVLERPKDERSAFLDVACRGNPSLRPEVESLLLSSETSDVFEWPAAASDTDPLQDDEPSVAPGSRLGPYQVSGELGRGGMGTVYLGVRADEQFHKRVAIKVVRRGMDSQFVLRRFRQERQILAGLEHPNIARILDGGNTDDGLPYFVMEYVEGQSITAYCDGGRLPIERRLELFRTVCSAVEFAHQNLVVHRDLKPSNVFVTTEGVPKLLDFGIAKLLNPELSSDAIDATGSAMRLLTPDYASPEQVRGERITTASDVYSLGVLLYELLTGHKPYRVSTHAPEEIARAVCEQEPERPSTAVTRVEEVPARGGQAAITITPESVSRAREGEPAELKRLLVGDLDAIVMKAMRKEPNRRYASVEQLSEDIRRYLEGQPVGARKGTFGYKSAKFLGRHKLAVGAAALILLTFLGGMATTLWEARIASLERARAERRFNDVRKLAKTLLFEIHDGIAQLSGSTKVRELLVARALEYLDSLAKEQGNDRSLQQELAEAYERVGDVQGAAGSGNLGDTKGARASYLKAMAIRETLVAAEPANRAYKDALARSYLSTSSIEGVLGDKPRSLDYARKAVATCEALLAADPESLPAKDRLGGAYHSLGMGLWGTKDDKGAFETFSKEAKLFEELAAADPRTPRRKRNVGLAYKHMAAVLGSADRARALEYDRKALALYEAALAGDPTNGQYKRDISFALGGIADSLFDAGDFSGAVENSRKCLTIREELFAADPRNASLEWSVGSAHRELCAALAAQGDLPGAVDHGERALAIADRRLAADPENGPARELVASVNHWLGEAYEKSGRLVEARRLYRRSVDAWEALRKGKGLNTPHEDAARRAKAKLEALDARLTGSSKAPLPPP